MNLNEVNLIGRIGKVYPSKNPEVCTITLATSYSWKDKASGEYKQETEWHRIICYKNNALIAATIPVGDLVYVKGAIKTSRYVDKHNVERETKDISCFTIKRLTPKKDKDASDANGNVDDSQRYENVDNYLDRQSATEKLPDDDKPFADDDIPF